MKKCKNIKFEFEFFGKQGYGFFGDQKVPLDEQTFVVYGSDYRLYFIHSSYHGDIRESYFNYETILPFDLTIREKRKAIKIIFDYIVKQGGLNIGFNYSKYIINGTYPFDGMFINPNANVPQLGCT